MATYNSLITDIGTVTLTRLMAQNRILNIDKIKIGDGIATEDQNRLTNVISQIEVDARITDRALTEAITDETGLITTPALMNITVLLTNRDLVESAAVREIGLFATVDDESVLFAYAWLAGEDTDNILYPPKDPGTADTSISHNMALFISNQENAHIEISFTFDTFVTHNVLSDKISTHNLSTEAHPKIITEIENLSGSVASLTPPGITNFIAEGLKLGAGDDTTISVSPGKASIAGRTLDLTEPQKVTLDKRMAALAYAKLEDDYSVSFGKVNSISPLEFVDNSTLGLWIFNETSAGAQIRNSAVGLSNIAVNNNLVAYGGLSSVDGWNDYAVRGDGSTGYYVSTNATNFPASAMSRQLDILFTVNNVPTAITDIVGYGAAGALQGFGLRILANGNLALTAPAEYDTNYTVSAYATYLVSLVYNGVNAYVYVNGELIYQVVVALVTLPTFNMTFMRGIDAAARFAAVTLHYSELRNTIRPPEQISEMANRLLLPNRYYIPKISKFVDGFKMYDIATEGNAISGGDNAPAQHKSQAFNKKGTANYWQSSQTTTAVSGIAFIGQRVKSKIKYIEVTNYSTAGNNMPSVLVQYSKNDVDWITIQTQELPTTASVRHGFYVNDYDADGTHYIRLLANDATAGSIHWIVFEIAMFTDIEPINFVDIRQVLPRKAISLGFVRTNSDEVIKINDTDYKYGRHEGAILGNRRVFLGWQYFAAIGFFNWTNPFATRKVMPRYVWAQDSQGTNESDIYTFYTTGIGSHPAPTTSARLRLNALAGLVHFNGANIAAGNGFIGCYVEVMEDDN